MLHPIAAGAITAGAIAAGVAAGAVVVAAGAIIAVGAIAAGAIIAVGAIAAGAIAAGVAAGAVVVAAGAIAVVAAGAVVVVAGAVVVVAGAIASWGTSWGSWDNNACTDQGPTHTVGLATVTVDPPTLLAVLIVVESRVVTVLVEAPSGVRTPVKLAHTGVPCIGPQRNLGSLAVDLGDDIIEAMRSARP